jgi:Flp pilus assembly protein TadD
MADPVTPGRRRDGRLAAVAAALAAATIALYWPVLHHGFVFDDEAYVTGNPEVLRGLGWPGLRWAATSLLSGYWHPLTWLSHMLDVSLFGLDPGPHHAAGMLLHAANAALLLLVLARMTGAFWRPALVAALFALHPLHVESVAWVAERKDVLSAFMGLLVLLAAVRAARRPGAARTAAVAGLFALAVMSKPMAVSLPLVLLLLDRWPLARLAVPGRPAPAWPRLAEKLPLLLLAALASGLALFGSSRAKVLPSLEVYSAGVRAKNAAVSAVTYLAQAAWPAKLAAFYPLYPEGPPARAWVPALALLAGVTALAWTERRRRPWLAAGWGWYLVTLLPVSGLVQLGWYARADRYTYLPLVGIFVIVAWGGAEAAGALRGARRAVPAAFVLALLALAAASRAQIAHWKDPLALFGHALEVTEGNWLAHYGLAEELERRGEAARAEEHYRATIALNPGLPEAWNNLGILVGARGDVEGALGLFREAVRRLPRAAELHYNLAVTLERAGRLAEARESYCRALELDPGNDAARAALESYSRPAPAGGGP